MAKDTQVQIRLSPELKAKLKQKGNMSGYIHGLIEKDLALRADDLGLNDLRPPLRETVLEGSPPPQTGNPTRAEREALLSGETMKLKGQGMTTRVATQEAKRRLGL